MPQNNLIETVITPDYVNDAKEGKATGSLKCGDQYYNVAAEHVRYFQKGAEYKIAYATKDYNGREFRFVRQVHAGDKWMPVEADKPLQGAQVAPDEQYRQAAQSSRQAANHAPASPQSNYGAITQKDKLIWVESYIKTFAAVVPPRDLGELSLVSEAMVIFDQAIQPWLEGKPAGGPGDRERAVKNGDAPDLWDPGDPGIEDPPF